MMTLPQHKAGSAGDAGMTEEMGRANARMTSSQQELPAGTYRLPDGRAMLVDQYGDSDLAARVRRLYGSVWGSMPSHHRN
ncbi:MAG: hypothetical protein ACYDBB_26325, partial [Armatimonadota bacterium]